MHKVSYILLIIGGLNWLLFGILGWDVGQLFGPVGPDSINLIARIIYILVGLAAIHSIFTHKGSCRDCVKGGAPSQGTGSAM